VLGDGEGHVVLVGRDFSGRAFRAYKHRVNAVALLHGSDVLVTLGDGADARPAAARAASRAAALAARDKLRRDRDRERATAGGSGGKSAAAAASSPAPKKGAAAAGRKGARAASEDDDEDDDGGRRSDDDDDGGPSSAPDTDLGYVLGLGVPLETPSSSAAASSAAGGGASGPSPDDPAFASATIKVWRLDRRDPRTGAPECVRTVRVFTAPSRQPEKPVTALAANEELSQVAVGCADGTLLLLRSDWLRERGSAATVKYQLLQEPQAPAPAAPGGSGGGSAAAASAPNSEAVTFLGFASYADPNAASSSAAAAGGDEDGGGDGADAAPSSSGLLARGASSLRVGGGKAGGAAAAASAAAAAASSSGGMPVLFHVSRSRVRSWFPNPAVRPPGLGRGWGPGEASILLDDAGAEPGCACLSEAGELVTGNGGGVFYYSAEDRRGAYPFPGGGGAKTGIATFRSHHVVVATVEDASTVAAAAGGMPGGGGVGGAVRGGGGASSSRLTLTIYDLRSKFIAFSMSLAAPAGPSPASLGGGKGGLSSAALAASSPPPQQVLRLLLVEWGMVWAVVGTTGATGIEAATPSSSSSSSSSAATSSGSLGLSVYQLTEKDTGSKVDTLCALQLYDVAAAVAAHSNYGGDGLKDIYRKHGDHLYGKGDWEGAVGQYVRTLGHLEPSYVIRRFLDAQRIPHLATYLEALHASGRAAADHTTLLLYAYTKLRASSTLKAFIRGSVGGAAAGGGGHDAAAAHSHHPSLSFDVRTVIGVLRDLSSIDPECHSQALYLAEAHGEHDAVVGLLTEMAQAEAAAATSTAAAIAAAAEAGAAAGGKPAAPLPAPSPQAAAASDPAAAAAGHVPGGSYVDAALSYIRRLPFASAEAFARRYGRSLMAFRPFPVTDLLVDLCSGFTPAGPPLPAGPASSSAASSATADGARARTRCDRPETLLPLFVDQPHCLRRFAWALAGKAASRSIPPLSRVMWHSLLEVALTTQYQAAAAAAADGPSPSPSAAAAAADELAGGGPPIDVLGGILRDPSSDYDPHYALLLCQRVGYKPGCLFLYERLRRYGLVLQHYMETADAARAAGRLSEAKAARRELLRKAKAFSDPSLGLSGEPDPTPALWTGVLQYLTRTFSPPGQPMPSAPAAAAGGGGSSSSAGGGGSAGAPASSSSGAAPLHPLCVGPDGLPLPPLDDSEALLTDALRTVERSGVLPPTAVVSLLGGPPGAVPFGLVREYLIRRLSADREAIAEDGRVVESLRADAVAMLNEAHRLGSAPTVFQSRRCRSCGGELDLPSVHFLCGGLAGEEHSFHAHCVSDNAALLAAAVAGGGDADGGGLDGDDDGAGGGGGLASLACPLCAGEQRQVRELRASLGNAGSRLGGAFFEELAAGGDGWAKATEYLAKGVMSSGGGSSDAAEA
jgi:hypothetical protein